MISRRLDPGFIKRAGVRLERRFGEYEVVTSFLVDAPNRCLRGVLMVYGPNGALLRTVPATGPSMSRSDMDEQMRRLLETIAGIEPDGTPRYR
ncbi:hypothetical protein [Pseudoxanthomonas sp. X-1]|uniref:hypothetical protein n=1 Tax=Pseudoxanthomonas sp. X-1 TaxID=2571115 RepID=UPI00110AD4AD|nr:hypothetical protein [Pseudoxanthomonas sp. X-1]TMN18510.1 hypothetical protein FF950_14615 [Pseudoxanthomonas sp. X-1]UAY75983.1 hypothetical protein LAJ50_07035 [Pseudoxanthomonas sp. X-1]